MSDVSHVASNSGNENNDGNESSEEQETPPLSKAQAQILQNEKSKYKNRQERKRVNDRIPFEGDIIETYWKTQRKPVLARVIRSYYNGDVRVKYLDEQGGIDSINLFRDTSLTKFDIIESIYFGEKVDFTPIPHIDDIIKIQWRGNLGSDTCKVVRFEAIPDPSYRDDTECKANEKKSINHFKVGWFVLCAVYCATIYFYKFVFFYYSLEMV